MGVEIEIIGAGGYIQVETGDYRPVDHGAKVSVSEKVAAQLIADRVAVKAGETPAVEEPVGPFDAASSSDEELAAWVVASTIADIETVVGIDQELAARVLAAEQARGEDARSTLVGKLEDVATS